MTGPAPSTSAVTTYAYGVVVADPETGEVDVHGPMTLAAADDDAARRRADFDRADLADVVVTVVRMHTPGTPPAPAPRGGRGR